MSLPLRLLGIFLSYLILALAIHLTTIILHFRKKSILRAFFVAFIFGISAFLTIIPVTGFIFAIFIAVLSIKAVYEEGWLKSLAALILGLVVLILLTVALKVIGVLSRDYLPILSSLASLRIALMSIVLNCPSSYRTLPSDITSLTSSGEAE